MHVILAAGGTGGHLFPALAIGESFARQGDEVLFVGSGRPLDRQAEQMTSLPWQQLTTGRLKGMGIMARIKSLVTLPLTLCRALIILIREKPDLVLGLGGASTGPLVMASRLVGIKAAILEQNRIPGLTNRCLAYLVNRIFIAFPQTFKGFLTKRKTVVTGNPLRSDVVHAFHDTERTDQRFTLLVFGGSQGAHFLNQLMQELSPRLAEQKDRIRIIHITGDKDFREIEASYRMKEMDATVLPFIENMGPLYKQCDVVVGRAGAATISDLITFGLPALLVPYPYAADDHQWANAAYLKDAGAAYLFRQSELNTDRLWDLIRQWREQPEILRTMATKARQLAPEDPAERIVKECKTLVSRYV